MRKYTPETHPVIAIDFDGTIVSEVFPDIGELHNGAIDVINDMIEDGYEVVIWTARSGDNLNMAIDFLESNGLSIRNNDKIKVNDHSDYMLKNYDTQSVKIGASVYIDDKAYGAPDFTNYWPYLRREFLGK